MKTEGRRRIRKKEAEEEEEEVLGVGEREMRREALGWGGGGEGGKERTRRHRVGLITHKGLSGGPVREGRTYIKVYQRMEDSSKSGL